MTLKPSVAKTVQAFRKANGKTWMTRTGTIHIAGPKTPQLLEYIDLIKHDRESVIDYLARSYPPCPNCRTRDLERYEDGLICDECLLVYPDKGTR